METALIKVFAFVCIIVAGYCMGHTGKLGNMPGEFVSKIVFTFTLPCSVVHAFVVADEGADVDPAGVLSRVAGLLPSYFVPHDVTILDEWPLSANGKVDRKALAGMAPEAAPSASSLSEPDTEAERAVASVWEELLDAGPVGRESNFFELGGDSLMAMRMTSALEKRLGFKIGLQEFISDPTVAGICQKIDTTCGDTYEEGTL